MDNVRKKPKTCDTVAGYERLRVAIFERRCDRIGLVMTCVMFLAGMSLVISLSTYEEGTPDYLVRLPIALFVLLVAGFIAVFTAVLQVARVLMGELERLKHSITQRGEPDDQ